QPVIKGSAGQDLSPRDAASGLPTGKRQHGWTQTEGPFAGKMHPKLYQQNVDPFNGKSAGRPALPRDAASGQGTGKGRIPVQYTLLDSEADSADVKVESRRDAASGQSSGKREWTVDTTPPDVQVTAPRDAASGQATGKRQHVPVQFDLQDSTSDPTSVRAESPRDAASGQATGKLQIETPINGTPARMHEVTSPRDAASGLPTGRQRSTDQSNTLDASQSTDPDYATRDSASGLPTGKRQHGALDLRAKPPRDAASGQASGKREWTVDTTK